MDLLLPVFEKAGERGLATLLRSWGEPDIVHGHFVLPGGLVALRLAQRLGRPLMLTEHSSRLEHQTATTLRRRHAEEVYRAAENVIAVSPFQAQQVLGVEPSARVTVMANPVDTEFFTPSPDPTPRHSGTPFHFLSVAHLKARKGLDVLLRAAGRILDNGPTEFQITIGGEGPERSSLQTLAERLGLTGRVRFAGPLTPDQVRDAMRRCDAFVLPSRRESFGVVFAEAMACGKPVLTTRCGGGEYVVTSETGMVVPVDDADALAEAMLGMISGRIRFDAERIRSSAVHRFAREVYRRNLAGAYLEAVSGST
jgi:glycosyltransferase involved in cell wall biosynthesis